MKCYWCGCLFRDLVDKQLIETDVLLIESAGMETIAHFYRLFFSKSQAQSQFFKDQPKVQLAKVFVSSPNEF